MIMQLNLYHWHLLIVYDVMLSYQLTIYHLHIKYSKPLISLLRIKNESG